MMDANAQKRGHLDALDGLRGIASVVVVVFHSVTVFWSPVLDHGLENPASVLWNGPFAVHIFFVLSGFVLSLGFLRSQDLSQLASAAGRRYFRLTIPSLASVLITYSLIVLGFAHVEDCARVLEHNEYFSGHWRFQPSILMALKEGLWTACFSVNVPKYNGALWTMQYEFKGALLLFAALALTARYKNRWLVFVILAAVCLSYNGSPFAEILCGSLLCMLWCKRGAILTNKAIALALLTAALFFAWRFPIRMLLGSAGGVANAWIDSMIAAIGVVSAVAFSPLLQRVLSMRAIVWLGKISFPLYLIHWPIILTAGTGAYVHLRTAGWGHEWAAVAACCLIAAVSLAAAAVGAATVERWSIRIGNVVYRRLFVADNAPNPTVVAAPNPIFPASKTAA
jgi:peptidoglycan/LPS O-acetylase OafA/YrhL